MNIDIAKLAVGDIIDVELSGSNTGTYKFKCVASPDLFTRYLLCQTNLGDGTLTAATRKRWTANVAGTVVSDVKIPTYAQITTVSSDALRKTSFYYWTSTRYSGGDSGYYNVNSNGGVGDMQNGNPEYNYGTAPLIIVSAKQ